MLNNNHLIRNCSYKRLHIGKNNLIGSEYLKDSRVDVISHSQAENIRFDNYHEISISAFNPVYKSLPILDDGLLNILVDRVRPDTHLIYFSTARVLDATVPERHAIYVQNKQYWEEKLKERFKNLKIIYLPLLISDEHNYSNSFFESMLKNLKNNAIIFDCDLTSSWNIVRVQNAISAVENLGRVPGRYLVCSRENSMVINLIEFCRSINSNVEKIAAAGPKVTYPDLSNLSAEVVIVKTKDNSSHIRNYLNLRWKIMYEG